MKRLILIFVILVLVGSVSLAATRSWKSSNGRFTVEAELLDFKDGKAQLKKSDGSVVEVPLVSLCEEDRRYVKSQFPGVEEEKLTPGVEYRDWKTKNGKFSTVAEFLGCEKGKVQLRKPDGSEVSVDKKLLSEDDQRWVASELKRRSEEEKESNTTESETEGEVAGQIAEQEVSMKLVKLDPPKGKGRGKASVPAAYIFSLVEPQQIYVKLGKDSDAKEAEFHRAVTKEPTYNATMPIRGVVKFGAKQYGFAIDSSSAKAAGYNRLYFDLNGNGDLTDDKPIASAAINNSGAIMSQSQFPRVDMTLDVDRKQIEASFLPSVICRQTSSEAYATVTFYSAAVREGYLMHGAKRTNLLLLDHNSNGRFDDAIAIRPDGTPAEGDLLLVNPKAKKQVSADTDMGRDRNFINKTVCIGRDFYRLEIPPAGDTLKLTPMKLSMGSVVNSSFAYRATLFSEDYGVVVIGGMKDQKIPLPESTWKVLGYSIEAGKGTMVKARFGSDSPPVTVTKGEAAKLPFGAPFHAVVTATKMATGKVSLSLAIAGVSGERCTNLTVNGKRPAKPLFVIKDKDGKAIHQGVFEWG